MGCLSTCSRVPRKRGSSAFRKPISRRQSRLASMSSPSKADARLLRRVFQALCRMRSVEHTSELQSLIRISCDVLCLQKKKTEEHQYYISSSSDNIYDR